MARFEIGIGWRTSARFACLAGVLVLATACDESHELTRERRALMTVALATPAVADSGAWVDAQSRSWWVSTVQDGRVRRITERLATLGNFIGVREYDFDSTGMLRRFTEDLGRTRKDGTPDSTKPRRVASIDFGTGVPVISERWYGDQPVQYSRLEIRQLERRAYALYDRSLRRSRGTTASE